MSILWRISANSDDAFVVFFSDGWFSSKKRSKVASVLMKFARASVDKTNNLNFISQIDKW